MKLATLLLTTLCMAALQAQQPAGPGRAPELRAGKSFMTTSVYSESDDKRLLDLFEGLRVADVSDGMDAAGLSHVGRMDAAIHPLWKDPATFGHRFAGNALTARYVPTNQPVAPAQSVEEYDRWAGQWYTTRSPEPFAEIIRPGTALVIDDAEDADVGSIGSFNILDWKARGVVGVVTDATARDTDEIETERVPLYFRRPGRGIRPGRNEIESVNRPVVCGGVLVVPGDVIVADGDGVVVVPRAQAAAVAQYARRILDGDKGARRELYKKLGLPEDPSVK